jgi:hypothetical protein
MRSFGLVSACISIVLLAACTDEGEGDVAGGSPPLSGGSPPVTTGGNGGEGTEGGGGAGVGGAGGSGGEAPVACLNLAPDFFTVEAEDLCIVETFTAAGLNLASYGTTPTWGAHGGPLTFSAALDNSAITLTRWTPSGTTLTAADTTIDIAGVPANAFFGSVALESDAATGDNCAGENIVSVAWSGTPFTTQGAMVTVTPEGEAVSKTATGVTGMAANGERIFYTGLSAVAGPTSNEPGLYSADSDECGEGITASPAIETSWGEATGPAAFDADGNLFAVLTNFSTNDQLIKGYLAVDVAGSTALEGDDVATLEGYGDAFAVVAPDGAAPGLVVMQTNAGKAGLNQDVVAVEYTATGGAITPGATKTLLALTEDDKNLTLMTDAAGRLWVGETNAAGTSTTFYVMARPPAE